MFKIYIAALCVGMAGAVTPRPCCRGNNTLEEETARCVGGARVSLNCNTSTILPSDDSEGYVGDEGELIFDGETVNVSTYCLSRLSNQEVFLLCFDEEDTTETERTTRNTIFQYISVFFIILTIVVYVVVPSLLDLQGICIVHSLLGLGIAYFTLGLIQLLNDISEGWCQALPFFPYTSFLYSFFWLNIFSFHMWRTIVNPRILRCTIKWPLIYHVFGISGPVVLLLVLTLAQFSGLPHFDHIRPGLGERSCWFIGLKETFIFFYGPISILLVINVVYYVWTVIVLWSRMKQCTADKLSSLKHRLLLCVKLFFIMGITWIFEVISAAMEPMHHKYPVFEVLWTITDTLNGLQGVLIFLILVVFRKRVRKNLANRKICNFNFPARWRSLKDEESEPREEELNLSVVQPSNGMIKP